MSDHTTPQPSALKVCSKCGQSKPIELFHRDRSKADGLFPSCKECKASFGLAHRAVHKKEISERKRAWREANKEADAERKRAYYLAHKEEVGEYNRAYCAAHKEEMSEHNRAYHAAHKEELNERSRAYHAANKEKIAELARSWREAHKEERAEYMRAWHEANPFKSRANRQRRRARKREAEGMHTAADIEAQYKRQRGKCYWCGVKVGETYHMDHIVPLSRGGSDLPENLVVACPICNMEKHNKLPHEWAKGGRLL